MNRTIIAALYLCSIVFYSGCNDGAYGDCTDISDNYCSGVYRCSDLDGNKYIKVASERYYCPKSLQWENTYDCSGGLAEAAIYCESRSEPPVTTSVCHKPGSSGQVICYPASIISQDQCTSCGWSYSAVTCDEYADYLIISGSSCQ